MVAATATSESRGVADRVERALYRLGISSRLSVSVLHGLHMDMDMAAISDRCRSIRGGVARTVRPAAPSHAKPRHFVNAHLIPLGGDDHKYKYLQPLTPDGAYNNNNNNF